MGFREAVEAAEKRGDRKVTYWWEREYYRQKIAGHQRRMAEDKSLFPGMRIIDQDDGTKQVWIYLFHVPTGKVYFATDGSDDGDPFDVIFTCPPNYPPGGPPCP